MKKVIITATFATSIEMTDKQYEHMEKTGDDAELMAQARDQMRENVSTDFEDNVDHVETEEERDERIRNQYKRTPDPANIAVIAAHLSQWYKLTTLEMIDTAIDIEKEFVKLFPDDHDWEKDLADFDEALEEFTEQYMLDVEGVHPE